MGIIVKDFAEILKLVISEGRLLVTITIVGLIVLIVFAAGTLAKYRPSLRVCRMVNHIIRDRNGCLSFGWGYPCCSELGASETK